MYRTFQFWWRSWFGQQSASGRLSVPQFVVGLSSAQPAWPPFAGCVRPFCWLPTLPLPKVWLLAAAATCKESWATTVLFARDSSPMRLAWLVNWETTSICWTWRLCSSLLLWEAFSRCYWYFHIEISNIFQIYFKYISLSAYIEVLRPGFLQSSKHPSPRAFRSDKLSHWFGLLCGLFLDKCCFRHHYCPTLYLPSGCLLLRRPVKAIVRLHELAGNYQLNTSIN